MKKVWFFILVFFIQVASSAQDDGYSISVQLDGYPDGTIFLGNYFGDKLAITDTAVSNKGTINFSGDVALRQGVYFLVSGEKKKLFEFLIGEDQKFKIEKAFMTPPDQATFIGSAENELFYGYMSRNKASFTQIRKLGAELKTYPQGHDSIAILKAEMDKINEDGIKYKLDIIEEYPESMIAVLFNIMRETDVPDFFLPDGRQDSIRAYLYYRNNYWEYVDFADDRFLRTPVFHKKVERYMNDVIPAHPDSVIHEVDLMIAKSNEGSEMHNYLIWYFTNEYETSKVMSYDKIFVHMVDEYFTNQSYDWIHPAVQKNMVSRADQMRKVLIGAYAPALVMADTSNQFISLHQVEAEYIIVLFWSSTCGECQREVETINDHFKETNIDVKIYAVNTDTTFSSWKTYITKNQLDWIHVNGNMSLTGDYHLLYDIYSTPVIYLLDEQKAIVAKRLAAEKLPAVIDHHQNAQTN